MPTIITQSSLICDSNHQLLKVVPPSAPPYAVKVSNSKPVYIFSPPKSSSLPIVDLNVNTESNNQRPIIRKTAQNKTCNRSLLKPRAVKVPITVQMPLQEKVNNITFYKTYPRPIAQSTFAAKKVGGAILFNSKRVNLVRSDFKSVLAKKGRPTLNNAISVKSCQTMPTGATIYTAKPLGQNSDCRFPKTISVIPNINTSTILTHRPNILRAAVPQKSGQHVPKILATGLKRPNSSPHITNISDCKHLLLKPGVNNIIGKMIVQPRIAHEPTESGEGTTPSQIMEKIVSVNIK